MAKFDLPINRIENARYYRPKERQVINGDNNSQFRDIIYIAILLGVLLLFVFFGTYDLVTHQQWASFGTFAGGIATPIAVLLAALKLAQGSLEHSKEMEQLKRDGHKADIYRIIEGIESDMRESLMGVEINVSHPDSSSDSCTALNTLTSHGPFDWSPIIPEADGEGGFGDEKITIDGAEYTVDRHKKRLIEVFYLAANSLCYLMKLCEAHDKQAGNNVTCTYFAQKYMLATKRLNGKGYPVSIWKPIHCNPVRS